MNVVALAGGVGGAKMAYGLVQAHPGGNLSIIVNVGDDFEHFGLKICPDLDTVCYTLAGFANPQTGWGRADETWEAFQVASRLGGPEWFHLGDRDLGVHLERTRRLQAGQALSQVTRDFCESWGITAQVYPATDDPAPTWVETAEGSLPFQEYFVRLRCEPVVRSFTFRGIEQARPAPGVLEAIRCADVIVFCPSNPWVSVDPILSIPGIRSCMVERRHSGCPLAAVSPIIGGKAIKGPAAKMFTELGIPPSALAVAAHYQGLVSDFFLDKVDAEQAEAIAGLGIKPRVTDTVMNQVEDRRRLAQEVLGWLKVEAVKSDRTMKIDWKGERQA
jgi:LPPG:FO 2-phospho-L-lactate transferase